MITDNYSDLFELPVLYVSIPDEELREKIIMCDT